LSPATQEEVVRVNRQKTTFQTDFTRFNSTNNNLSDQYYPLYQQRYNTLSERIKPKWENHIPKIVHTELGVKCYINGTIYKEMKMKINALDAITREAWIEAPPPKDKYCSEDDKILLEDFSGRVTLSGNRLGDYMLTTGMVVGVYGKELANGTFEVENICFPEIKEPGVISNDMEESQDVQSNHKWVALISGLNISNKQDIKHQLLSDYLTAEVGSLNSQIEKSQITRVIIAGNSIQPPGKDDIEQRRERNQFGTMVTRYDPVPIELLDDFLYSICSSLEVDVMAGETDPSSVLLPQTPIHSSLFKKACCFTSLQTVSNPYEFTVGGTNDQNVDGCR
jgi:DNA polymerase delta subunit 2